MSKVTVVVGSKKSDTIVFIRSDGSMYPFPFKYINELNKSIKDTEKFSHAYMPWPNDFDIQKEYPAEDWEVYFCENLRVKYYKKGS